MIESKSPVSGPYAFLNDQARKLVRYLLGLNSRQRSSFVVLLDIAAVLVSVPVAYALRVGISAMPVERFLYVTSLSLGAWVVVAWALGTYKLSIRNFGFNTLYILAKTCFMVGGFLAAFLVIYAPFGTPRTMGVLQPLVMFMFATISRVSLAAMLSQLSHDGPQNRKAVVVYGAQDAALALGRSLRFDPGIELLAFVDHDGSMKGKRLEGRPVVDGSGADEFLSQNQVDELLIALDRPSRAANSAAVDLVHKHWPSATVRKLPSLRDLASGRVSVGDLREVKIEDLLGREPVAPLSDLLDTIRGKSVLVTGAGGSIGSELCRQIAQLGPSRILLAERSELALYTIEGELTALSAKLGVDLEIVPLLADVGDSVDVERIFRMGRPELVYHAAAYKHVPLVEANATTGIVNNVVSTLRILEAAERFGCERFTLVSTDKAVRPTNVMGASKRMCELIVQARAAENPRMAYSAVRFGNVLGSSGSVVPLFRSQIAANGPITLTHGDVTRYFMTIPEAALLVIQAGAMGSAGDIFLLDMGDPIRIRDLAEKMVELSGLTVRDANRPDGDIEIVETGLRPGEKLYEELLIDADAEVTKHPRIVRGREQFMPWNEIQVDVTKLIEACRDHDDETALSVLAKCVPGFGEETVEPLRLAS
ncbi:polysaccharide biosynthesis protein [Sphingomicrobium aestuariivivum]|uniref:polysaccharide biosynthesis protein n=1 Tax=Sphingomicrobium aestuariivivum TaxID=1582356 RepID=UPI001FD6F9B7|nr:nucleoside-diphosphate sugar epimerase/dehydratase [Sphingomicrobium aestuariivivum]MCJ8191971.1 polysaccharide biosynthesis protein [Sphingomicrobium aestuariivivum]